MCLLKTTVKKKEKTMLADLSPGIYLFFPLFFCLHSHTPEEYVVRYNYLSYNRLTFLF